jgi:mRNA-degrading endonuclease toxin of MazEF toxin-antitoxin module
MLRGEVYWVRFDPAEGGEIKKTRPAIVVSNDTSNKILNRVQVVPVTSRTDRVFRDLVANMAISKTEESIIKRWPFR